MVSKSSRIQDGDDDSRRKGRLQAKGKDHAIIDVSGISFKSYVPASLLDNWEGLGREVELFTHLHVRENELSLYGCGSQEELAVFELLLRLLPSIIGGYGLCRNSGESRPTN